MLTDEYVILEDFVTFPNDQLYRESALLVVVVKMLENQAFIYFRAYPNHQGQTKNIRTKTRINAKLLCFQTDISEE